MFTKLKTILARKRIKQVGNQYIPQVLTTFGWQGMECKADGSIYTWVLTELQMDYCAVDSLSDANAVFQRYYEWKNPKVFAVPKPKKKSIDNEQPVLRRF